MKSPFGFAYYGELSKWVSDIFPNLLQHVDKMAFVHSAYSKSNNHSPAFFMANTGFTQMGYPCIGFWVTYGLGSEDRDVAAFVVMADPKGRGLPKGYSLNWGAGFLPSIYQGTWLKPSGDLINNLNRPQQSRTAWMMNAARILPDNVSSRGGWWNVVSASYRCTLAGWKPSVRGTVITTSRKTGTDWPILSRIASTSIWLLLQNSGYPS